MSLFRLPDHDRGNAEETANVDDRELPGFDKLRVFRGHAQRLGLAAFSEKQWAVVVGRARIPGVEKLPQIVGYFRIELARIGQGNFRQHPVAEKPGAGLFRRQPEADPLPRRRMVDRPRLPSQPTLGTCSMSS